MLAMLTVPEVLLLVIAGPVAIVLVLAGPWYLGRHKVLGGIRRVVDELIAGRTERRADPTARGELGALARGVNQLATIVERQQEQAIQERQHLASVLEYTDDAIVATDAEDHVTVLNPAAAALFGRARESVLGKPLTDLISQADVLALYHGAYSSATPIAREVRINTPRRHVLCQITATTMYAGPQYRGTLLLVRDLTQITQAVQMKTDFVTNASHELRTPLASIRAAVETMRDSFALDGTLEDPATVRRCVEIIGSHVLRLQLMVQDLLDLARTEDPRAVVRDDRVDLQEVCDMVTGMYSAVAAQKELHLVVELHEQARILRGDERLLVLTLKNLVDNAMKFTPSGGTVTVRSFRQEPNGRGAAALVLEVQDTGSGIPPEEQQRVFERFYTVNQARTGADRGTGLGLAIVKHAVAAMGGTVTMSSQVGRGTTVRCVFQAAATTGALADEAQARTAG